MNKKLTQAAQQYISSTHASYCDYNQKQNSTDRTMVEKGHPLGAEYTEMRAFFDTLSYACNSAARRFTYKNNFERSEYWAPDLGLSWYPVGEGLAHFGHVYPSHDRWGEYIQAVADAGWPAGATPEMNAGSWNIRTQNEKLREAFLQLAGKGESVRVKPTIDEDTQTVYYDISVQGFRVSTSIKLHRKVVALLQKHQKGYVLPQRSSEQDLVDNAPLPLSEKKFMLANVSEVTVDDRMVRVPLVALPMDEALVLGHVNNVVSLVKQGLPFVQARTWLEQFLTAESFKELSEQFA